MRKQQVISAQAMQRIQKRERVYVELTPLCEASIEWWSASVCKVFLVRGPDHILHSTSAQGLIRRPLRGFDKLCIEAGTSPVHFQASTMAVREHDVIDPTPAVITLRDEYERSLSVQELVAREIAKYHRAYQEDPGEDTDDLDFDDDEPEHMTPYEQVELEEAIAASQATSGQPSETGGAGAEGGVDHSSATQPAEGAAGETSTPA